MATGGGVSSGQGGISIGRDLNNYLLGQPPEPENLRVCYLRWVFQEARGVPLSAIDPRLIDEESGTDVDLAAVYTALMTESEESREAIEPEGLREAAGKGRRRRLSAAERLNSEGHLPFWAIPARERAPSSIS